MATRGVEMKPGDFLEATSFLGHTQLRYAIPVKSVFSIHRGL